MVIKKKLQYGELQGWHWFIPLFVMPCVLLLVLFSSNSYALTTSDVQASIDYYLINGDIDNSANSFYSVLSSKNWGDFIDNNAGSQFLTSIDDNTYFLINYFYSSSLDEYLINFYFCNSNVYFRLNGSSIYGFTRGNSDSSYTSYNVFSYYLNDDVFYTYLNRQNIGIRCNGNSENDVLLGNCFVISNSIIYNFNNNNQISYYPNSKIFFWDGTIISQNSITLSSTSLSKFSYSDFNQCLVTITGDWTFEDFVFYVERYINDEWVEYVPPNENFVIYGYENPWYVTWNDINYWQVGTYRYVADYHSLGTYLYYSPAFSITGSVVENGVTGTIDNGNIDIDIDTGKTVDDIKDFMGSPADFNNANITQNDIENALNLEETVNPYDNFVLSLINGLTSSLTGNTSTSWTFKVHTWGETFTFYPSDVIPPYSQGLHDFLAIISTTFVVIIIVKWITQIVESVNVGDVSKSLELIEEKYSDLL